jgi:hypothetical protein
MSETGEPQKENRTRRRPVIHPPAVDQEPAPAASTSGTVPEEGSALPKAIGDQLLVAVHNAYLQVGRTVIERSITRTNIVLTSATAAVTAYTALLGLIYSTAHGRPLPAIALWPVLYMGLAIALTAFYAGYLAPRTRTFHALPVGANQHVAEARLATFLVWVVGATMYRAWAMRIALVSLSLGLMLLPVGFISIHGALVILVETVPVGVLSLYIGIEIWRGHKAKQIFEETSMPTTPEPSERDWKPMLDPSMPVPRA